MKNKNNFCILIPCYEQHALTLAKNIDHFLDLKKNILIVNDGSSKRYKEALNQLKNKSEKISILHNSVNMGKGHAIKSGLQMAKALGYTHALQIDSDNQHDLNSVNKLIQVSNKFPNALVSGRPIYGDDIPKIRFYSRYLTHIWVWIETLSLTISDSMCGFRSYPLGPISNILNKYQLGNRMDFDTEIMVKSYWDGILIKDIDVCVKYPKNNTSHFSGIKDNFLISLMHTKLFFGMLPRIPKLLFKKNDSNWYEQKERGLELLMKISFLIKRYLPQVFENMLINILSTYYFLFSSKARKYSKIYIGHYQKFCSKQQIITKKINSFILIKSFAKMIAAKFGVWSKEYTREDIENNDLLHFYQITPKDTGAIFISSHFGNLEIMRCLGADNENIKFSALMYGPAMGKLFNVLNSINPKMKLGIINTEKVDLDFLTKVADKLKHKEHIFCMGDRTLPGSPKIITQKFLTESCELPQGPFILGYLLKVPVFTCHCYRENHKYKIAVKKISPDQLLKKDDYLKQLSNAYIKEVEALVIKAPEQWYNFNNFWKKS